MVDETEKTEKERLEDKLEDAQLELGELLVERVALDKRIEAKRRRVEKLERDLERLDKECKCSL